MEIGRTKALMAIGMAILVAPTARAQSLPSEPIVLVGNRVTIGGDLSLTFACAHSTAGNCSEDTGFFNDTAFSHPFFAVTDVEGRYRIENVPAGTYRLIAWNEGTFSEPRPVTVPEGGVAELDFALR